MPDFLPTGPLSGSQESPLDSYVTSDNRTGNKTTNKDLPQWLQDLGMGGDAYAGGMLKPQIRYGMWYKNGKLNFADGRSFDAKKNKDGTYAYTGADGVPTTYDPTDEQDAYNKQYKMSTSNQSFLDKATNAVKFELDHGMQIIKGIGDHPQQIIFGIDPIGTKIGNAVTGDNATPQVDQMGGALDTRYKDYEDRTGKSSGYAKDLQGVAHVIASIYGGKGLGKLGAAGAKSLGAATEGGGILSQGLSTAANAGAKVLSNPKVAGAIVNGVNGALQAENSAAAAAAAAAAGGNTPAGTTGGTTLPASTFSRHQTPYTGDFTKYGFGPEHKFFESGPAPTPNPAMVGIAPPTRIPLARGGSPMQRGPLSNYVAQNTGAGGREDNIDAKLSENEYVIDAETVALLGDGNPEAGARKLDAMRSNIRSHKGKALAKGGISPDAAGTADAYFAEGGKVGALKALGRPVEDLYHVVDRKTGEVMSSRPMGLKVARRRADGLDTAHGATRYVPQRVGDDKKFAEGGKVGALSQAARKLTLAEAKKIVREHGHTLVKSDGEYIVKKAGERTRIEGDDSHYFTDDIDDAVGTSAVMAKQRGTLKKAEGGPVRPRQSLSSAMDEQDADFDKFYTKMRPPRGALSNFKTKAERKGTIAAYGSRMRSRVGDTSYDIDPPQRVAQNKGAK